MQEGRIGGIEIVISSKKPVMRSETSVPESIKFLRLAKNPTKTRMDMAPKKIRESL